MNKHQLQNDLYRLPYHYLPQIRDGGDFVRHQSLRWGFAYLCYLHHIAAIIAQEKPRTLLDAGCGDGRLISLVSQHTAGLKLTGLDNNNRAVAMAQALNPEQRFICGALADVKETFSFVSCIEVLEHIPDDRVASFISDLVARTEPGGKLLIGVPTNNKPMSAKHHRHYDRATLIEQLATESHGLQIDSCEFIFNGNDPLYRFYTKLSENRFWFISVRLFENLMWKRVWTKLRYAEPCNGHHLLLRLSKSA
ncbi:MAG: hypothetical protein CVV41_22185 [Candidatus Riflebacteria bacterium HGW-Riflebacteria-1]|jgi:SAM-dependent methyltransferase|nr:MAG: hypothetical protein CVV41_22185 [Candidatus Riflebacteria bacterium HGW-Riflebacteria-1]